MGSIFTRGKVGYLADLPIYEVEKPYDLTIHLWHTHEAKPTNILLSKREILIKDMTDLVSKFSSDVEGFEVVNYPTAL